VVSSGKRTRGPNKQAPWARSPDDGVSVLRLALDTSDPVQRARIEAMFRAAYAVRRAVQRDARDRARAYRAATHERARGPAAVRERLGLSRTALEHAAYGHLDAAPHLRRFMTKALAMHLADGVWTAIERHLFADARGQRHGMPRVGRWHDFTRLPGRARSHTTANKWETARLCGTLAGHRAAYTDRTGDFVQPRHLRPVHSDAWWSYEGPLAVVFTGLANGALVLPVRLPTAPSNQPIRARRRAAAGLRPVDVIPMGPRNARADGVPLQSYRRDQLSASYRRGRAAQAADAAADAQARRDRARQVAADLVATHGYQLIVEDASIAAWSRSWGRAVAAFSPGLLIAALDREARAVATIAGGGGGGGVVRVATRTTALSQHCPCGARVTKRLAERAHRCPACSLRGDRDAVAAVLASFVVFAAPGQPSSAQVDYIAAADALLAIRRALSNPYCGWQDTLTESTDLSAREGSFLAWSTSTPDPVAVARRTVGMARGPTLDETGLGQTTPDRAPTRTNMAHKYDLLSYFRDTS